MPLVACQRCGDAMLNYEGISNECRHLKRFREERRERAVQRGRLLVAAQARKVDPLRLPPPPTRGQDATTRRVGEREG